MGGCVRSNRFLLPSVNRMPCSSFAAHNLLLPAVILGGLNLVTGSDIYCRGSSSGDMNGCLGRLPQNSHPASPHLVSSQRSQRGQNSASQVYRKSASSPHEQRRSRTGGSLRGGLSFCEGLLPIPYSFPIPTCSRCHAEFFDVRASKVLAPPLHEQYLEQLWQRAQQAIDINSHRFHRPAHRAATISLSVHRWCS